MNFSSLSHYLKKLEETDSRLEMKAILADLIKNATVPEIAPICYLSLGRLGPLFDNPQFNMASKMMVRAIAMAFKRPEAEVLALFKDKGDLGEVSGYLRSLPFEKEAYSPFREKTKVTVAEIYQTLLEIAKDSGSGSQERKLRKTAKLIKEFDPLSAKYLVRIVLGTLRLGFSEITIVDALSHYASGSKSARAAIEQAFNVYPDIGYIAKLVRKSGLVALSDINLEVGVPFKVQLCQRVNDPAEILERHGGKTAAEPKLDGTRVQLHFVRDQKKVAASSNPLFEFYQSDNFFAKTFTRNLEETTHQYPEIIKKVATLKAHSLILDGEAIGVDSKTGETLPFQKTITRKRKHGVEAALSQVQLLYVVFDLLYCDGRSLLKEPLQKRRQLLAQLVPERSTVGKLTGGEIVLGEQQIISSKEILENYFKEYVKGGGEGLVCKDVTATYRAGGRGYTWIKLKNLEETNLTDTIDCLVMGLYKGRGKRNKFGVGAFLVGVLDQKEDCFKTIAKIGTGLTDKEWEKLAGMGKRLHVEDMPKNYLVPKELTPDVWFSPKLIVSIRADNITQSPLHSAGKALRFPRLMAWREDKAPSDATSLREVTAIQL